MEHIESWMMSLLISVVGLIAMLAVGKYKTEANERAIEVESNARKVLGLKLDKSFEELIDHKSRLANATTMEDVRREFVSKEMFRQMEKHIDSKFDDMGKVLNKFSQGQEEILKEIRRK